MCGLALRVEDGRVGDIRGDELDPLSRGHVCPKAVALKDLHEDPDRLRRPLRRTAQGWQELGWDEALDEAAERLHATQNAHGRHAVAVYLGNPVVHDHGLLLFSQVFERVLNSRSRFSATSTDQLPHMLASLLMFGNQLLLPVPDVDRTDLMLVLGANPLASNGSLMTAPGIERRLRALRERGGNLVVVDPRRTETARMATHYVPVRPGSDALLLLAVLHVLFEEGLTKPGRLAGFSDGLRELRAAAARFPPERVADATGVAADDLRALARAFAAAPSAVAYGRVGLSTQEFGGLCAWLVNALNAVSGNLDRAGGAMFTRPAADLAGLAPLLGLRGGFARRHSRVRGLPEFGGEWPVATLADEIEHPGPGQIRALVTIAGNPVLSAPGGRRLDRALAGLDFVLALDPYLNETSRHAHLVLPPVSPLERDHYDLVFHLLAVRDTARYSPAVFPRPAEGRHDWETLLGLATRLLRRRGRPWGARALGALGRLGPTRLVGLMLRLGPRHLGLGRLRRAPHGIDFGPLEPCLPRRLSTEGRRLRLAPQAFVSDLDRLEKAIVAARPATVLVGRRDLRSNNSWLHNSERLVKGPERCTLLMHPADAGERRLRDGQRVRVSSVAGAVEVPLQVSAEMRRGVVSLPHGWGHERPGTRLRVAASRPGASVNDVNDEERVDALCGTAAFSAQPVEVSAVEAASPVEDESRLESPV